MAQSNDDVLVQLQVNRLTASLEALRAENRMLKNNDETLKEIITQKNQLRKNKRKGDCARKNTQFRNLSFFFYVFCFCVCFFQRDRSIDKNK